MAPRLPALLDPVVAFGQIDPDDDTSRDPGGPAADRLISLLDSGADGIASDVWLTADGVAVLARTGRVGSRLRRRPLGSLPAAETPPDSVTPLDQILTRLGPDVPVSLDVRDPAAFEAVIDAARRLGDRCEERLWLCHDDLATLTSWRARTAARLLNAARYRSLPGGLERRAAELEQRNIDGLRLPHGDWTGGRVTLLHRFGRLALGTGPVHEREMAAVIDTGIDGVVSRRVTALAAVMAEFHGTG